jgi:hypothetical protein
MIYTNVICNICEKIINLDEIKNGEKNCVVCPDSHRCHKVCFSRAKLVACPVCGDTNMKFCTRSHQAYLASKSSQRMGGKRKTNKQKSMKRKSKRVNKYK